MSGQQLFFFLLCFGAVNCGGQIYLNPNSSWIASGYQFSAETTNITTNCPNCTIQLLALFETGTQSNTNFTVSDAFGTRIQSQSFNASMSNPINFKASVLVNDYSVVPSYSLSFRMILPTEDIALNAINAMVFVNDDAQEHTFTQTSSGPNGTFVTFTAMPSLWRAPTIAIQPTNQIVAGCEYYLYQDGIPGQRGASQYLVYRFHAGNSGNNAFSSFIPAYAATVFVPPNCPISIDAKDYTGMYNGIGTITINSVPRTGFIMSRNYPGAMDEGGNRGMNIDLKYELSPQVFGNRTAQFTIDVDTYLYPPGPTQLSLLYDDQVAHVFNATTWNFADSRNATSFRIKFTPGNRTWMNVLLHFSTKVFDMPTTTTLATTNTAITRTNTIKTATTAVGGSTTTMAGTNTATTKTNTITIATTTPSGSPTTKGVHQLQIFASITLCLCFILKIQ